MLQDCLGKVFYSIGESFIVIIMTSYELLQKQLVTFSSLTTYILFNFHFPRIKKNKAVRVITVSAITIA